MPNPKFGTAFGPIYEYYASLSGLWPRYRHTLEEHQRTLFGRWDIQDLVPLGQAYFITHSGLRPIENYTVDDHIVAYFQGVPFGELLTLDAIIRFGSGTYIDQLFPSLWLYPSLGLFPRGLQEFGFPDDLIMPYDGLYPM